MPLPLEGVRILDFTWLNAGAKGTRHLALYGAEMIHLEWKGKLDVLRFNPPYHKMPGETSSVPEGGSSGYEALKVTSVNRAASHNNNHVGKWGVSLNMRHPKGKEIFRELVKKSDAIVDNFTATTLADWGFGSQVLEEIKPDIIYVQAPGFGLEGPYRDFRSYGPTAAAISGLTAQSGLPDRYPAGYGFSYMDVCGPYFIAMAVMAALRQRERTGRGVHVDLSQVGPAFLLAGTSLVEWSANGKEYERTGNRSPYSMAAPHGAYRCEGPSTGSGQAEAWIAIACYDEEQWQALVREMGSPSWTQEAGFRTLEERYANQDALDERVDAWTQGFERYALMERLQAVDVPAGVCQDTRDRYEIDPQLKHREYFVTMPHSEVPPYDVEGHAGLFSETQPDPFGTSRWGAPCYGEHNVQVYSRLLGMSEEQIEELAREDVI